MATSVHAGHHEGTDKEEADQQDSPERDAE
jgi:hypothetical protein